MKLFIPEIKTTIKLTKDWTFTLYPEYRNTTLGELFGHYIIYNYSTRTYQWVNKMDVPPMRKQDFNIQYPSRDSFRKYEDYQKAIKQAEDSCPEYISWCKDNVIHRYESEEKGKNEICITLPAGTILIVDRVYIRKGLKDYSSLSFIVKNLGEVTISNYNNKKKKVTTQRFWAKLEDCNNIEGDFS